VLVLKTRNSNITHLQAILQIRKHAILRNDSCNLKTVRLALLLSSGASFGGAGVVGEASI
jgi:hypothetical protein